MGGFSMKIEKLLLFFVDVHAVEVQAVVGHLTERLIVNKHPANEILVFINRESMHSE